MAIITRTIAAGITGDPDTIRFVDRLDTDLSHYFEMNIDSANNLIDFLAKIGDFRFKDADDAANADTFQITGDVAASSIVKKVSNITDSDIFTIIATGTISGATATADLNYLLLDLDALVLNDAATQILTIIGQKIDFNGATLTAMSLSSLYGLHVDMPTILGVPTTDYAGILVDDAVDEARIGTGTRMSISAQGINDEKYYKCEDFDEELAAVTLAAGLRGDEWLTGGLNDAAANVTYIQGEGGVLQMNTNGADDDSQEYTWVGTTVAIDANPVLEFRIQIDSIGAADAAFFVGVTETADIQTTADISAVSDDYFVIGMDSDLGTPADLRAYGEDNNGGQVLTQLTGHAIAAATWTTIRMDLSDTEQPRVWINFTGGAIRPEHEIGVALLTQTVQAGIFVMPVLFVNSKDAGVSAATLLVDYVKIWQDRS